jgi:hypothetical protein
MSSPQSLSDSAQVQNTTPAPVVIPPSPEMEAAKLKFTKGEIDLRELIRTHKKVIIENTRKGITTREEFLYVPLSCFTLQNGVLSYGDYTTVPQNQKIDPNKVAKTFKEAKEKFKRDGNVMEFRESITSHGGGHPILEEQTQNFKSIINYWNPEKDKRPGTKGNNKSRVGSMYDCGTNRTGMYLQGVTKKSVISAITAAHMGFKLIYNKDAFVYDDPMLIELDFLLKQYIDNHTPDKANYKKYDMELFGKLIDLFCGIQKEDIKYRVLFKDFINTFCGKVIYPLTPEEQEHFDTWCHK